MASPLGRLALHELQAAWAALDRAGVRVVAIVPSPPSDALDFVPRHHLLFPVVLDVDRAIAQSWGVQDDRRLGESVRALSPALLRRAASALSLGSSGLGGPHEARAAVVLLGRDGRVAWSCYARSVLEGPDLGGLIAAIEALP